MSRDSIKEPSKSKELLAKEDLLFELLEEVVRMRVKEYADQGFYDDAVKINDIGEEEVVLQGMMSGAVLLTEHQMPMQSNPVPIAYQYGTLRINEMAGRGIAGDYASMGA